MHLRKLSANERIHGHWTMASPHRSGPKPDGCQLHKVRHSQEST